ncbi:MAG: threonine/serine dehydratase [Acidimicrobiia bacterium]
MIDLAAIRTASERIQPYVVRTPMLGSRSLSERLGTRVSLKVEAFQRTGSFKPRGAINQLLGLSDDQRARGVVGFSGGNFAQGLAYAGQQLGVATTVVMPEGTPSNYVDATRGYGANIELTRSMSQAIDRVDELSADGLAAVHPFDNLDMIHGNGSVGLEIVADAPDATDVVVSIGGGGFIAGVAAAVKGLLPQARVWGVETEGADAMSLALAAGKPVTIEPTSIAKTLAAPWVSELTLAAAQEYVDGVTVVSDAAAIAALEYILERTKILTEPASSCTVAAAEELVLGEHVVIVLCGGNVSLADVAQWRDSY